MPTDGVITAKEEEEEEAAALAGGDLTSHTSKSLSGCSPTSVGYGEVIPHSNAFLGLSLYPVNFSAFVCIIVLHNLGSVIRNKIGVLIYSTKLGSAWLR